MRFAPLIILPALAGCASVSPSPARLEPAAPPRYDALYTPGFPVPGHLEYSPDRDTFAPILTDRVAYPTQGEANNAFARAISRPGLYVITFETALSAEYPTWSGGEAKTPASLHLFACAPGALNDQTGRIELYRGHVVHCATDFSGSDGARLFRATANFYYADRAWSMVVTHPPMTRASWLASEHSPHDAWWWVPFRGRYE